MEQKEIDKLLEDYKTSETNLKTANETIEKLKKENENLRISNEEYKKYNQVLLVNANTNIPQIEKPNLEQEEEKHINELKEKVKESFIKDYKKGD